MAVFLDYRLYYFSAQDALGGQSESHSFNQRR